MKRITQNSAIAGTWLIMLLSSGLTSCINECYFSRVIYAWVDEDGNGIRNDDEVPLADVTFVITMGDTEFTEISDADGEALIDIHYTCLSRSDIKISVIEPSGYRLTTAPDVLEFETTDDAGSRLMFGFSPIE